MNSIMSEKVEFLGRRAAELEVDAARAKSGIESWRLLRQAEAYRKAQEELLMGGLRECEVEGCKSLVIGDTVCARCREEIGKSWVGEGMVIGDDGKDVFDLPTKILGGALVILALLMVFA